MGRCEAITKAGSRCQGGAMEGSSWCYSHDPALAETRKSNARRGGKTGGRGRSSLSETEQAKRWTTSLVTRLVRGEVERDTATAAFQGINTYLRAITVELQVRDQLEVVERLEALEEAQNAVAKLEARGYGA